MKITTDMMTYSKAEIQTWYKLKLQFMTIPLSG